MLSGTGANLTYTPNAGYFGPESFQFTDSDGTATSSTATVSITVVGPPTANAQSVTLAQNAANVPITLTGTDPNTPALPLTFTVTSGPAHGTLSGTGANLTYTPNTGYSGPDSFQFTVSNGTLTSGPATVSITVKANERTVSAAFGPTGLVVEVVNSAGVLTQYDARGAHVLSSGGVRDAGVAYGPAGPVMVVTYQTGALVQFDAAGAHLLAGGGVQGAAVAFGPLGEVLLVTSETGALTQISSSGATALASSGVKNARLAFGPFGEELVVTTEAGALVLVDAAGTNTLARAGVQSAGVAIDPLTPSTFALIGGRPTPAQSPFVLLVLLSDGTLLEFGSFGSSTLGTVP
jgi:hypothetical protein